MLNALWTFSAGVGGMDLMGPNSIQAAAQAQSSHLHPHAAAMMQHAVAAQQTNGNKYHIYYFAW